MKLNIHHRELILSYLSVACLGMILLAGSLGSMELKPGLPLPGASTNISLSTDQTSASSAPIDKKPFNPILVETMIGIGILILFVMILYGLVINTKKSKIGIMVIGLIGLMTIFNLLGLIQTTTSDSSGNQSVELTLNSMPDPEIVPIEKPPEQLFWLVIFGLSLLVLGTLIFLFSKVSQKPIQENSLAQEANKALQEIQEGKDLRNIIINCYFQFNRIIKEEYEIEREKSLTAREFEIYLSSKGIPIASVHNLTTLFEKVRYGNKPTDLDDERIAIESLSAVRLSCQKDRCSI